MHSLTHTLNHKKSPTHTRLGNNTSSPSLIVFLLHCETDEPRPNANPSSFSFLCTELLCTSSCTRRQTGSFQSRASTGHIVRDVILDCGQCRQRDVCDEALDDSQADNLKLVKLVAALHLEQARDSLSLHLQYAAATAWRCNTRSWPF